MSNAWKCTTCGHGSKYGGAPAIALHNAVSHGTGERITEIRDWDGRSYKGYELRRTFAGWVLPALSSRTYDSAEAAIAAIDASGIDARA